MVRSGQLSLLLTDLVALDACGDQSERALAGNEAAAHSPSAKASPLALSASERARIGVRFASDESATELPVATVPATLAPPPSARVSVAAVIPGVVTRTLVVEGDAVRAGQPLAVGAAREMFTLAAGIDQASARTRTRVRTTGGLASPRVRV